MTELLTDMDPNAAAAAPDARISLRFIVGLTVSLVLHGLLLGVLLLQQGSVGSDQRAATSSLSVEWQAHTPVRPTAPPPPEPERVAHAGASEAPPRSSDPAPMPAADGPDLALAPVPASAAATTSAVSANDVPDTPASRPSTSATTTSDDAYLWDVHAHLRRFQEYPERARQRGLEGTVWLRARVSRRGVVLRSEIERSSGHALLDDAAVRLVARASPLPPPPAGVYAITDLSLPLDYRLHRE